MAVSRVCLVLLLIVCLDSVAGKPFFGLLWCDWFCDDYDDDDTTTTPAGDDDYGCGECSPQRRGTTTPAPSTTSAATTTAVMPGPNPSVITLDIPPGDSGYTFTLTNTDNKWGIMMVPKPMSGTQATTTTGTTTVVTTTAAGATTAAATTAAATTTAAPDTTTAARK